jgi:hypothetical protein
MALLTWDEVGNAQVNELATGHPIEWLAKRAAKATWTAIDAPFGWPDQFIETISHWAKHGGWPMEESRSGLRFRLTDLRVAETKNPLSVSSDRIASTAMFCAQLLEEIARYRQLGRSLDRTGGDRVVECYPAAALKIWAPSVKSFKGKDELALQVRQQFLGALVAPAGWLVASDSEVTQLVDDENLFDALICSLVARAVALGREFVGPTTFSEAERPQVEREGWIYLPAANSLQGLGRAS